MSQATAVQDNHASKTAKKAPAPPDERFWQRYSPHHEFPLSVAGSIVLHAVCFFLLLLIVGGLLARWLNLNPEPPEISAVAMVEGGGGGDPQGVERGAKGGVVPTGQEAVQSNPQDKVAAAPIDKPEELKIEKVQPRPPELDLKPTQINDRMLAESDAMVRQLKDIHARVGKIQEGLLADKGYGKGGSGGGSGGGDGTGVGTKTGPGTGNSPGTVRQKRQARWFMEFPPGRDAQGRPVTTMENGRFLLKQLNGMGAALVIRQPGGKFLVIKDLLGGGSRGDHVNELTGMYWIWDKPEDVRALTLALNLKSPPADKVIAAFFPEKLEAELLAKEKAASNNLPEDEIELTVFEVVPRGGAYEPIVKSVTPRGRR
jgi:hypothetical protein